MPVFLLFLTLCQPAGYWLDSTSTAAPDGVTVLAPPDCQQSHTEELRGPGYLRLAHQQIVLGSVTLDCGDPAKSCDDWRLHGHRNYLTGGNPPYIDHARGLLRLPFPELTYRVSYRYAASPGRWVATDTRSPLSPSMLGAAGDGVTDDTDRLAWTINVAAATGRGLYLDRCYAFGCIIELPAITITGRGADVPGLRMLPSVLDMYRHGYIRPPLTEALNQWPAHITAAHGAKSVTIRDVLIEGAAATVNWADVTPANYYTKRLADDLQNSPTFSGLSVSDQSNRRPPQTVTLENVAIRDCLGSCLLGFADTRFSTRNLTLENSVGCRLMYSALGTHQNLSLKGYGWLLRAEEPFVCAGLTYRGGDHHPWPLSANYSNQGGIELGNVRSWPRMPQPTHVTGLDLDFTGTPITRGLVLCGEAHIEGTIRHHDSARPLLPFVTVGSTIRGAAPGARITLRTINGASPVLSHVSGTTKANWQDLIFAWHNTVDANHQTSWPIEAPVIRVARQPDSPAVQTITLTMHPGTKMWNALHVPDAQETPARDCVPTIVVIRGSVLDLESTNVVATRRGATEETQADIADKPLRVRFVDCVIRLGTVGTPRNLERLRVKTVEFVRCQTPDGGTI